MRPCTSGKQFPLAMALTSFFAAACTTPNAPAPVAAVRYEAEIQERRSYDLPEIQLPDLGIACNVGEGVRVGQAGQIELYWFARAFDAKVPRNQTRRGEARPTERCELPPELAAQLAELARLTREQQAFAERLGERLAAAVPLNYGYEADRLREEIAAARARGVDSATLEAIDRRWAPMRDGSEQQDCTARLHALRKEVAALTAYAK